MSFTHRLYWMWPGFSSLVGDPLAVQKRVQLRLQLRLPLELSWEGVGKFANIFGSQLRSYLHNDGHRLQHFGHGRCNRFIQATDCETDRPGDLRQRDANTEKELDFKRNKGT